MENDEKMFPEVAQSEACLTEQPTAGGKCTDVLFVKPEDSWMCLP